MDAPFDTTGFKLHRSPVSLVVERGTADVCNGADGTVRLFLFQGRTQTVCAGIAVYAERAGFVDDRIPVREDKGRGTGANSARSSRIMRSMSGVKAKAATFLRRPIAGRIRRARF